MIHIRSGTMPVKPALFNEAFKMHTSTSPQSARMNTSSCQQYFGESGARAGWLLRAHALPQVGRQQWRRKPGARSGSCRQKCHAHR